MFSKFLRKLHNFILVPFTFKNWIKIMRYILSIYLSNSHKSNIGLAILRDGQRLKIRLKNIYDIGSILETWQRKVYFPSFLRLSYNAAVFIDVGASIGDFSVFCASSFKDAIVLSYEPTEEAFRMLEENVALNSLENKIRAYQVAVSGSGKSIVIGNNTFKTVGLADIFVQNSIGECDLLKMDVEGVEYDILLKTPIDILREKVKAIAMEAHIFDKGENLDELKSYLTQAGFFVTTTRISSHDVCYLYAVRQ